MLISNGLIVTMDSERRVLDNGAILVDGDQIIAVGKSHELEKKYVGEVIDADGMLVLPVCEHPQSHLSDNNAGPKR